MEPCKVAGWRAKGIAVVSADAKLYRVEIGYGEMGYDENFPLGEWVGMADSAEHAEEIAMDAIWDGRLDVVCSPRIKISEVRDGEDVYEGVQGR